MPLYELAAHLDERGESERKTVDDTAWALASTSAGEFVEVLSNDLAVVDALRTWVERRGHELVSVTSDGSTCCVVIRHA